MKKIILLLLAIPLLSLNIENDKEKFVGKWLGEDQGQIGKLTFDNEGYASFEIQGEIFGGKEFVLNGRKGKMVYEINTDTNPIEVDFIVTLLDTGDEKRLLCIANFIDPDTMQFAIDFTGDFGTKRPQEFNSENSIIMIRE